MGYVYDASGWPVVLFRFSGRLDIADNERYFRDSNALLEAPPGFTCVLDGVDMALPEVELVRQQANWIRTNREAMRQVSRGFALIAPSAVIRGLVRAVFHIQPLPVPYAIFAELDEGLAWARERATALPLSNLPPR